MTTSGIANELKLVLKKPIPMPKVKVSPTLRAEEAYTVLAEKMDAIRGMFTKTQRSRQVWI